MAAGPQKNSELEHEPSERRSAVIDALGGAVVLGIYIWWLAGVAKTLIWALS